MMEIGNVTLTLALDEEGSVSNRQFSERDQDWDQLTYRPLSCST